MAFAFPRCSQLIVGTRLICRKLLKKMNVQLAVDSVGGTLCLAPQILNTFAVHSLTRVTCARKYCVIVIGIMS